MKLIVFIVLTMTIFGFAWGEESCSIEGTTVKAGETYQPSGECKLYKCEGARTISLQICPLYGVPLTCTGVKGDVSKPYPSCCDSVECIPFR